MKKIFNILLVLVMLLTIVPVNAASGSSQAGDKGSITICKNENDTTQDVTKETYTLYRILDLASFSYESSREDGKYSYVTNAKWFDFIYANSTNNTSATNEIFTIGTNATYDEEFSATPTHKDGWVVTIDETLSTEDTAKTIRDLALEYVRTEAPNAESSTQATADSCVKFSNLPLGYYLVDSTMGVVCNLNTTDKDITINEKNYITPDKEIIDNGQGVSENSVSIGDTVAYELTFAGAYGFKKVVGHDTLSEGLTLINEVKNGKNTGIVVKNGTTTLTEGVEYEVSISSDKQSFTVTLKDWYTTGVKGTDDPKDGVPMEASDTIVVSYSAKVNEKAQTAVPNTNDFEITYGNGQKTDKVETKTYTYEFNLIKVDGDKEQLAGAKFKLYESDKSTVVKLVKTTNGYRVASTTEASSAIEEFEVTDGKVKIEGLGNGTYYLEETKAPEGYNKLAGYITVTVDGTTTESETAGTYTVKYTLGKEDNSTIDNDGNLTSTVINTTGTVLPSTGGMGTVLFITIGSLMVLGFGVLLVTKFRMSKELA